MGRKLLNCLSKYCSFAETVSKIRPQDDPNITPKITQNNPKSPENSQEFEKIEDVLDALKMEIVEDFLPESFSENPQKVQKVQNFQKNVQKFFSIIFSGTVNRLLFWLSIGQKCRL